ncbi:MAG: DUF4920 domain-containing protein [Bacteroidota bacterium]|jgi:hypothetical protein
MRKLLFSVMLISASFIARSQSFHGEQITEKGAISATELETKLTTKEEMPAKVTGVVESVCKAAGCWMKVKTTDGKTMRVTFKDYGFFVPKDITGKTVVFEGVAKVKTTSVAMLKHYAEDGGKSKEEIAKITEPEKAIGFVATGVIVK